MTVITSNVIPITEVARVATAPDYWPAYDAQPRIDLEELSDCLELFYHGDLDWVPDNCLTHLSGAAWELIPGRPLESVLDNDTMAAALSRMPLQAASDIAAYWAGGAVASGAYGYALAALGSEIMKRI